MVKLRHYFIALMALLAMVIIGACQAGGYPIDYLASNTMYYNNPNIGAAVVTSNYIAMIYSFVQLLVVTLFLISMPKGKDWKHILLLIFGIICMATSIFFYFTQFTEFEGTVDVPLYGKMGMYIQNAIILVIFGVGIYLAYHFIFSKIDNEKMFPVMCVLIVAILGELAVSTVFKYLWSRPRPWLVFEPNQGLDTFRAVYMPKPFDALFNKNIEHSLLKSFPSGHVGRSGMIFFIFIPLSTLVEKYNSRKVRTFLFYFGSALMIAQGLLRVASGAHFLSDVAFGGIIALTVGYFVPRILESFKVISFKEE